jgi:hypothetical protein
MRLSQFCIHRSRFFNRALASFESVERVC